MSTKSRKSGWKLGSIQGLSKLGCKPKFEFDGQTLSIAGNCVGNPVAMWDPNSPDSTVPFARCQGKEIAHCWKSAQFGNELGDGRSSIHVRFEHGDNRTTKTIVLVFQRVGTPNKQNKRLRGKPELQFA